MKPVLKKITRKELLELNNSLKKVTHIPGVKFAYIIAKNIHSIEGEIRSIVKTDEAGPEYQEFENERIQLASEHSKKQDNGRPETIMINGVEEFNIKNVPAFEKEYNKLKEKYAEVIVKREEQLKEINKFLEEEIEVELYTIKIEDVPSSINGDQLNGIYIIID